MNTISPTQAAHWARIQDATAIQRFLLCLTAAAWYMKLCHQAYLTQPIGAWEALAAMSLLSLITYGSRNLSGITCRYPWDTRLASTLYAIQAGLVILLPQAMLQWTAKLLRLQDMQVPPEYGRLALTILLGAHAFLWILNWTELSYQRARLTAYAAQLHLRKEGDL